MKIRKAGSLHGSIISSLVFSLGVESYLEFGTHWNETIGMVNCPRKYGVDLKLLNIELENTTFFEMTTQEFIEKEAKKYAPYDFVFIDADHSYVSVRKDFFGIIDHVSPEGLVCLHDTNPELVKDTGPGFCGDSWRFAEELWKDGYEAVTLPFHPGLTIMRNRQRWGPIDETD
jgi:predicted O-methyltransferase YrrM